MCCSISAAPRAQFSPIEIGFACRTEYQKASVVCPDRVRPERSVIVPDIIIGRLSPWLSNNSSNAKMQALAFNVSKMVSIKNKSIPPSSSADAASL